MVKDYQMSSKEWQTFKRDTKMFKAQCKNRYYCRCGHSVLMTPRVEKAECDWCHRLVFKDIEKQKEYDEKNKKEMEKLKAYYFRKEMSKRL
jgi:CDGSH-type Zn-finger protein